MANFGGLIMTRGAVTTASAECFIVPSENLVITASCVVFSVYFRVEKHFFCFRVSCDMTECLKTCPMTFR